MVKGITPFSLETVLQEDQLVCLEAWKDYVFAGLSDGSLLLIQNKSADGQPARWVVRDAVRSFANRHVLQLTVAHFKGLLLSLTEEGVSAHLLPSLRLNAQALRTKGANIFAWDDSSCTLCVVVKRRLLVFKYEHLEIVEQREISLPGAVHSMQVVGGSLAYVGLKQEYIAVDLGAGTFLQLFASKAPHTGCTVVPPLAAGTAGGGAPLAAGGDPGAGAGMASGTDTPPREPPPLARPPPGCYSSVTHRACCWGAMGSCPEGGQGWGGAPPPGWWW